MTTKASDFEIVWITTVLYSFGNSAAASGIANYDTCIS